MGRTDEAQYITEEYLAELEAEMMAAAEALEFERAAALRDRITQLRDNVGQKLADVAMKSYSPGPAPRRHKGGSKIPRPKKRT